MQPVTLGLTDVQSPVWAAAPSPQPPGPKPHAHGAPGPEVQSTPAWHTTSAGANNRTSRCLVTVPQEPASQPRGQNRPDPSHLEPPLPRAEPPREHRQGDRPLWLSGPSCQDRQRRPPESLGCAPQPSVSAPSLPPFPDRCWADVSAIPRAATGGRERTRPKAAGGAILLALRGRPDRLPSHRPGPLPPRGEPARGTGVPRRPPAGTHACPALRPPPRPGWLRGLGLRIASCEAEPSPQREGPPGLEERAADPDQHLLGLRPTAEGSAHYTHGGNCGPGLQRVGGAGA